MEMKAAEIIWRRTKYFSSIFNCDRYREFTDVSAYER